MSWDVRVLVEYDVEGTWTIDAPSPSRRRRKRREPRGDPCDLLSVPSHSLANSYPLAALLTGWNPDGRGPPAIAPRRGLPRDASASASMYAELTLGDVTWLRGQEILDYPLWDEALDVREPRLLDLGQFAAGLKCGFDQRIAMAGVGTDAVSTNHKCRVTTDEMQYFIHGLGGPAAVLSMWRSHQRQRDAGDAWRRAHRDRPPLTEVHAAAPEWDSRVRFVCWELLTLLDKTLTSVGGDANRLRMIAGLNGRGERWGD